MGAFELPSLSLTMDRSQTSQDLTKDQINHIRTRYKYEKGEMFWIRSNEKNIKVIPPEGQSIMGL